MLGGSAGLVSGGVECDVGGVFLDVGELMGSRGKNRSTAVMQRRVEPHDSLDYFPTPPWATRALCEYLQKTHRLHLQRAWDSACGAGHMARPLAEYFDAVHATDVHDYRADWPAQADVHDFLLPWGDHAPEVDWVITNPPFRLAEEFVWQGLRHAERVALLVRGAFAEGISRYEGLFAQNAPTHILQFCERVPMIKGRVDPEASTATAYVWMIFGRSNAVTRFDWIPPCRKLLERPGDYDGGSHA